MSEPMQCCDADLPARKWHYGSAALLLVAAMVGCDAVDRPNPSAATHRAQEASLERSQVRADPGRCPGGGDAHTYFALGRTVVRVPQADRIEISRLEGTPFPALLPPDPSAQAGCRDNPIQELSLHLTSQQDALLGNHFAYGSRPLTALDVFPRRMHGVMASDGEAMLASMVKKVPCKTVDGGLVECVKPEATPTTPLLLTFRPEIHSAPMGRPFVVMCGFGPGIYNDDCSIGYQFNEYTAVRYRIDRRRTPNSDIAAIDQAVRDGLSRLIVPSYPWKDGTP